MKTRMIGMLILLGLALAAGGCSTSQFTSQVADTLAHNTLAYPRGLFSTGSY